MIKIDPAENAYRTTPDEQQNQSRAGKKLDEVLEAEDQGLDLTDTLTEAQVMALIPMELNKVQMEVVKLQIGKLRPIDREIIRQHTLGKYASDIGKSIGRSAHCVKEILAKSHVKEIIMLVEGASDKHAMDVKTRIKSMVHKALDVVEQKMDSEDEAIALRASTNLLDRDSESKIKTAEVPQYSVLSAAGVSELANIMKEVKGDIDGLNNREDQKDKPGVSGAPGNA